MAAKKGLSDHEKRVVKALFAKNWRNQDIHAWINGGRSPTVNFGRISGVKKDPNQEAATEEEVAFFMMKKKAVDPQTGLNRYDDEKLIRAREAMILAVQVFNSPGLRFKTEVFTMLANVAWTHLMHEYYTRKTPVAIVNADGFSKPLSELIERGDSPLAEGIKHNLRALKILRDKVEHHLLGQADLQWLGLFQACCLNFEKTICSMFGAHMSLASELAFALQFAKMDMQQAATLSKYDLPEHIAAIDALITAGMTPEQLNNIEFQFRVVYTLDAASKGQAHIQFVLPESVEGKEIHNVLSKKVAGDEFFPHKPAKVVELVAKTTKKPFTSNDMLRARKLHKVRPPTGSAQPGNTDKRYCLYHPAHKDYTYSDEWVAKLVEEVNDPMKLAAIRAVKL
jgi:hypothetical protein